MLKTYAQLVLQANVIKNATAIGSNTPTRVGQMIVDLIDSLPTILDGKVWTSFIAWDATTNILPAGGGTGAAGAIVSGNIFKAAGNSSSLLGPDGGPIVNGTLLVAKVDNPIDITGYIFIPSITA